MFPRLVASSRAFSTRAAAVEPGLASTSAVDAAFKSLPRLAVGPSTFRLLQLGFDNFQPKKHVQLVEEDAFPACSDFITMMDDSVSFDYIGREGNTLLIKRVFESVFARAALVNKSFNAYQLETSKNKAVISTKNGQDSGLVLGMALEFPSVKFTLNGGEAIVGDGLDMQRKADRIKLVQSLALCFNLLQNEKQREEYEPNEFEQGRWCGAEM